MNVLAGIGTGCPFDEGNLTAVHFDAGYGVWMDAGTGVAVARSDRVKPWAVGVSGGEICGVYPAPGAQPLLDFFAFVVAFGGAGGILETTEFQGTPDVADKPARDFPALVVKGVGLMAVDEVVGTSGVRTLNNQ